MAVQIGSNISDGFFDKIQFRLITRIKIDKLYYIELNWILRKDNHQNQINDYIDILQMDVFFFFGIIAINEMKLKNISLRKLQICEISKY